ncbi:hypothetical protein ACFCXR_15365 [Streptomyces noursei]|uniref:hypothetical protein n=1 Tax=Streptomyces noursei TaxID=1971 RepID=UPI0035DE2976
MPHDYERRIRIVAQGGRARIDIDEQRIEPGDLTGYTLSHHEGEPPHLVLHTKGDAAEFDGVARVTIAESGAVEPSEFLAQIDAEELERTALARLDLDAGPYGLTRAMLVQLAEWARGD